MNVTSDNDSAISPDGSLNDTLACSCQCCHGAKALKNPTASKNVRNHAAPYFINTSKTSIESNPCVQCKLKEEAEQRKQLQRQQYNCSSNPQQTTTYCHCQRNPSMSTPHLTVPPPPLPPAAPPLLPGIPQTQTSNLFVSTPTSSMTASNQMYFIPFGVPSIIPGPPPIMPYNPLPYAYHRTKHTVPPLPPLPSLPPQPPLPPKTPKPAKPSSSGENNKEAPLESEKSTETDDNSSYENGEQETIMTYYDYHDEVNPNNEVKHKTSTITNRPAEWQWSCDLCKEDHALRLCSKFLKASVYERYEFATQYHYCLNCLARSHRLKDCKSEEGCFDCTERHNSLLHGAPQLNQMNSEDLTVIVQTMSNDKQSLTITKETISSIIPDL